MPMSLPSPHSPRLHPSSTRRPLSPSSLRDVELPSLSPPSPSASAAAPHVHRDARLPAPPTGHDLMAFFPAPAPPDPRVPTSGYFARQERAFFAKAGREIVRVRVDGEGYPRPGYVGGGHAHGHHRRPSSSGSGSGSGGSGSVHYTHTPRTRPALPQPPPPLASLPTPPTFSPAQFHTQPQGRPRAGSSSTEAVTSPNDDDHDQASPDESTNPDEAWRRPMPHNEPRRRVLFVFLGSSSTSFLGSPHDARDVLPPAVHIAARGYRRLPPSPPPVVRCL
uniref:Uncharacterized protein n=1 Tax=Mycena chlorophos TaxID=658473 RepID=A0ABQ0LET8_MYCCL|nr:predicted protein [Mycena chlorophos]